MSQRKSLHPGSCWVRIVLPPPPSSARLFVFPSLVGVLYGNKVVRYYIASRRVDTFPLRHLVRFIRCFDAILLFVSYDDPFPQSSVPILVASPPDSLPVPLLSPFRPQNPSYPRGGLRGGGGSTLSLPSAGPRFHVRVPKGRLFPFRPVQPPFLLPFEPVVEKTWTTWKTQPRPANVRRREEEEKRMVVLR